MMATVHGRWMSRSIAALLLLLMVGMVGCASAPAIDDPIGEVPHDFSVDVAILLGRDIERSPEAHLRPLRMILFPDGSLHSGEHPRYGHVSWMPGLVRRLNRDQMAKLYGLARELNLSDPDRGDEFINPMLLEPENSEIVYQLALAIGDRRWQFVRHFRPGEGADPAITRFIRHLAELAWETDLLPEEPVVMPHRYDFGPDPYARYR
jgi:hypothetical protein